MKKTILIGALIGLAVGIWLVYRIDDAERDYTVEQFRASYDSGDLDGVIQRADGVLREKTGDIDALLSAATAYAMKGSVGFAERSNGQKAIEYADRALKISPRHTEALRIKGYALEIQERYDEAHALYDQSIESEPRNFQALSNKGHAFDLQGDLSAAEVWYRRSLEINPAGEHALLNISRLYLRQKKFAQAQETLTALIQSSSNLRFKAEAYQNLAEAYRGEMNYAEAKTAIEKSIELDPAVPQSWVTRGRIRMASFLDDEAGEDTLESDVTMYANKALAIHPDQASAYALLYDLASAKGDTRQRDEFKQKALAAIDRDISLGQQERQALRNYLEADISVVSEGQSAPLVEEVTTR